MDMQENGICKDGCPHFSAEMRICKLFTNGLYMPLKSHVESFCMTQRYEMCFTYKKYFLMKKLETCSNREETRDTTGRRHHPRIAEKRNVILRTCDSLGITVGDFSERAMTVDFSQGGMRVIINREISPEAYLLFDFGDDFLIPHLQGVAQLRWQKKLEDDPQRMEAGMVFKDGFSQSALALELGI